MSHQALSIPNAPSPKARKYEDIAADSRAKAEAVENDEFLKAYLTSNAEWWQRRADEIQRKANRRAYLRRQNGGAA